MEEQIWFFFRKDFLFGQGPEPKADERKGHCAAII